MIKRENLGGGTINSVTLDPKTGVVKKEFADGNGIKRPSKYRVAAEARSLSMIPCAPLLVGAGENVIFMKALLGEKYLDLEVQNRPEFIGASVYQTAGQTLKQIHTCYQQPYSSSVLSQYINTTKINLLSMNDRLATTGLSTNQIIDYLEINKSRTENIIKKTNLVWTHGDFWLNNLIGEINGGIFRLNGVIDWELAKLDTPFTDFAVVYLSIERLHPDSGKSLWRGYGSKPDEGSKKYFAVMKVLE